jgi:hypothetical protein
MIIGRDFDKLEFNWLGLELLEPNALLSDSIIAVSGIVLGFFVSKQNKTLTSPFFNYWKYVFFLYGVGFFLGGVGHVFYNYFGLFGKYIPLLVGLSMPVLIEHAMISLLPKQEQTTFFFLSKAKVIVAAFVLTLIFFLASDENVLPMMLLVPSINSFVGFVFSCGFLGWKFGKTIAPSFYILPVTILVLVPAGFVQIYKVSFHPWFDRNDFGHLLIIVSLFMYYYSVRGYRRFLKNKSISQLKTSA